MPVSLFFHKIRLNLTQILSLRPHPLHFFQWFPMKYVMIDRILNTHLKMFHWSLSISITVGCSFPLADEFENLQSMSTKYQREKVKVSLTSSFEIQFIKHNFFIFFDSSQLIPTTFKNLLFATTTFHSSDSKFHCWEK